MRTIDDILIQHPGTCASQWRQRPEGGWIFHTARVSGDARVYGDARVSGGAWIVSPYYVQGTRHAVTNCRYGYLAIGCCVHTYAYWIEHAAAIGRANGYTAAQIAEYRAIIQLMATIGK